MGVVKLGDVARESRLKWTKSKQDVPIVGLEHLIPDEIRFDAYDINTDNTFSKRFVKGQVLFGRRRAYQRKAAIAEFDGICSGDITVIEAIEGKMVPELLPFIIQTPVFFDYANRGSAGSLSPRVKWEHLADYEFELPPLEEQKILADKLWAAYRLKEAYKKLLDATDEMVRSQFIEMFGTVENNTHNFPIMTIGEFANCFAGATPSTSHPEYWENGRIRWMSSGEVHKGHVEDTDSRITELGYKSASTRMVPIHSIVIAIAGQGKTRGTVAITEVDLCTNQSLCAIVPDERVNYSYLYHNLQGRYLELRGLSGDVNGRGGLNLKIIQKIPVILPPIEKQQQFASIAQQADKSKFGDFKSQFIEMVGDPRNNPKGWPTKRLSELAEYSIGLTYKPEQICDDGTIVLRSGNIQDGKISFSDIVRVNAPIKESLFVKEDDILMCSRNGSASLVGKVAMIPDINEPMTFGAFMTIIRSAEAKYLYLYFQSQDFRERVSEGKSSTMNQITQKMLDKVEVPFPDKDVRETLSAIASQADKSKFGDFKSQFIEMFGNPLSSKQKNELKRLGQCCIINPRRPNIALCDTDKVSFIPMPAVSEDGYLVDMTDEEYGKVKKGFTYFENNDVLFAKITPCMENGKGAIVHGLTNGIGMGSTEFHVLRPINGISSPYWLLALTRMPIFRERAAKNMSGTGGQKRVSASYLDHFMVGLPAMEEQRRFEAIYRQADKSKFELKQCIENIDKVIKSLING